MKKQPYSKSPMSEKEQIELFKTRGLLIPDEKRAAKYLQNISYFRLSVYMYPFLKDKKRHQYMDNIAFNDILNLYRFDRELRQLLFASIEKIEIAFRAQIANHYSVDSNSPFWYTIQNIFPTRQSIPIFLVIYSHILIVLMIFSLGTFLTLILINIRQFGFSWKFCPWDKFLFFIV